MDTIYNDVEKKMEKTIEHLQSEYAGIRAGRANPNILEGVLVDYYGTPTPINQMASVSVAESRILVIQPWDVSVIGALERALQIADLGINPQNDGKVVRLTFPALTEDRRRDIAKDIGKMAEETKISIRNARREGIDELKQLEESSAISEDDFHRGQDRIQEITDKITKQIDKESVKKEEEIMSM